MTFLVRVKEAIEDPTRLLIDSEPVPAKAGAQGGAPRRFLSLGLDPAFAGVRGVNG